MKYTGTPKKTAYDSIVKSDYRSLLWNAYAKSTGKMPYPFQD